MFKSVETACPVVSYVKIRLETCGSGECPSFSHSCLLPERDRNRRERDRRDRRDDRDRDRRDRSRRESLQRDRRDVDRDKKDEQKEAPVVVEERLKISCIISKIILGRIRVTNHEHVLRANFIPFPTSPAVKETEAETAAKQQQIEAELKNFEEEEDEEAVAEK